MSGYGERRTFATDAGAGGEESEYLGLPFKSTSCEDWYGFGDKRCPNRYIETGDIDKDINSLIKWIGHYSGHGRSYWFVWATDELAKKQIEKSKRIAQEETTLPTNNGGQFVSPHQIQLSSEVNQILEKIESGQILIPDWFQNTVNWVKDGSIPQDTFLQSYNHQVNEGNIHPPISEPDPTITDNMVTQQLINFNIVNGRAVGSIKFVATNNFNPYYYGQDLVNIIQFKDPNGAYIKSKTIPLKENRLNFTETERDEVINYSEDMFGNTRATVESFVWPSAITPRAFSKTYSIEISEVEPPKPITTGFMSAGAAGAIAGLVLLGFIIDHKVSKR